MDSVVPAMVTPRHTNPRFEATDTDFSIEWEPSSELDRTRRWIDGPIGEGSQSLDSEVLSLVDVNFDGRLDLMLTQQDGGAGPNNTKAVFVFNPTSQRYEFNEALAERPRCRSTRRRRPSAPPPATAAAATPTPPGATSAAS